LFRDKDRGDTFGSEYDNKILLFKKTVTFGHGIPLKQRVKEYESPAYI
jgi:hypothetical protein